MAEINAKRIEKQRSKRIFMKYSENLNRLIIGFRSVPMDALSFVEQHPADVVDKEFIDYFLNIVDEMVINHALDFSYEESQYLALLGRLDDVEGFKGGQIDRAINDLLHTIRTEKDNDWYKGKRSEEFIDIVMFLRRYRESWEEDHK